MDKFFAAFQKIPMLHKVVATAILVVMIVAGYWYFVYTEQQKEIKKLDQQIRKLDEERQEKQEIAANLSTFKKMVEYLNQKLIEKNKNLPENANIDQLLKTLNELSTKADITISKFIPMAEVKRNFYAEIPVTMELSGNFHEILTFFDAIGKEDRIINVTDITMKEPVLKNQKLLLKSSCMAKTFRMLRADEMAPQPPPAGQGAAPGK
jgi:type IV pilus assembly protein PilO